MANRTLSIALLLLSLSVVAGAQVLPQVIKLSPVAKINVPQRPQASRGRTVMPLNSSAILAAAKATGKTNATSTADYLLLTPEQPFVANKASLFFYGGVVYQVSSLGSVIDLGYSPSGQEFTIHLTNLSPTQTYLADISIGAYKNDEIQMIGPNGGATQTFHSDGEQHLLFMITGQKAADLMLFPKTGVRFYSCKVTVLK